MKAKLGDAGDSKLLATISVLAREGSGKIIAKHKLMFAYTSGCDEFPGAKAYAERLLMKTH